MLNAVLTILIAVMPPGLAQAAQSPTVQTPQAQKPPQRQESPAVSGLKNIRLDLTIADQRVGVSASKSLTLILGDGHAGKIRTGRGDVNLNLDATVQLRNEGRILVMLTIEYRPQGTEADKSVPLALSESFTVFLEDGKPLVVTQSADPTSDRKINVEVKATVLK